MIRSVFTLNDIGREGVWLLAQQANGIPDAKSRSDFLEGRTALMLFAEDSLNERLCVTAAVRQMGGQVVFVPKGDWVATMASFPVQMTVLGRYYVDCTYIYGVDLDAQECREYITDTPCINLGSQNAEPANVLADLACLLRYSDDFAQAKTTWLGLPNGALYSLLEAAAMFPFSLRIAVPENISLDMGKVQAAQYAGAHVEVCATKEEAVRDTNFIFAGTRPKDPVTMSKWCLDDDLVGKAAPDAHFLLSASPVDALCITPPLLSSKRSLLVLQAENRLRVHKRLLHWAFGGEE